MGNSFTYYNKGVHTHLRALVRDDNDVSTGISVVEAMTIPSARLAQHVSGLRRLAAEEDWDLVVLQGKSTEPIGEKTRGTFYTAAAELANIAHGAGAEVAFYMTWAFDGRPEMTPVLAGAYEQAAADNDGLVVPVGLAFETATQTAAANLYASDGFHPSRAGTYLAACVFYAALYRQSPEGNDYTAGLDADVALKLQSIASRTVEGYEAANEKVSP